MIRWILLAAAWLLVGASALSTLDLGLFGKLSGWALFLSPILLPANLALLSSPGLLALAGKPSGRWVARVLSLPMLEPAALAMYWLAVDGTGDLPVAIILYSVGNVIACLAVFSHASVRRPSAAPGGFPVIPR